MIEVFIVIVEDRHTDVEAYPFSTEELAIKAARARSAGWLKEEDERRRPQEWIYLATHQTESDNVRVVRRVMDGPIG